MGEYLRFLLFFQRFIIPAILVMTVWAIWRTVFKKDIGIGLGLYVALVVMVDGFYNTGIYIPGFAQGSVKYSEVCALFLLFNRPADAPKSAVRSAVIVLAGVYFFLLFVAALRADPMRAGLFDYRRIVFPQIVALAIAIRGFSGTIDYRRFVMALSALVLVVGVFTFWDVFFNRWVLHSDMLYHGAYGDNRHHGRYGGVFLNPNLQAGFVVLVFPLVFVQMLREKTLTVKAYFGITLLALLFLLVETQSRAPMIAFVGELVILALGPSGSTSRIRRTAALVMGGLILLAVMPGFFGHASKRFQTIESEASDDEVSRASVWKYTQAIIAEHPLLGIGLGESQFLAAMEKTDFRQRYGRQSLDNPHNSYLQMTVYAGIPVLIVFALANLALLFKTLVFVSTGGGGVDERGMAFGLAVGVVGFLLAILPDMHLFTQYLAPIYWLCVGLLLFAIYSRVPVGGLVKAKTFADRAALAHRPAARPGERPAVLS